MASTPDEPPDIPLGDMLRDAPLLREIQRVMLSSTGPINWELARQIGIATASWNAEDTPPSEQDRQGLAEAVRASELAVGAFTGQTPPAGVTPVQVYRRAGWVEASTRDLRELMDPVAARMTTAMAEGGGPLGGALPLSGGGFTPGFTGGAIEPAGESPAQEDEQGAAMLHAMLGQIVPLLMGAQVGTVLGYLAQRVFGQFDLAVPRPETGVAFVVPNIAQFERDWSLPPAEFRGWVVLHEVAHRFEFGRPWVRPHFVSLVRDMVENAEIDLAGLERGLEGMDFTNPEGLSDAFEGMGNLFGEATSVEQRLRVARVQSFLAVAEGYADHVMDAVGPAMLPSYTQIEEAILRHREGRHSDQALERLIGLEMAPEQYRLGEAFCRTVSERTDEATLARMWDSAEALPSMPELEEPTLWLSRMA